MELAEAAGFDGSSAFAGESYDATALIALAMQAAKSSDPKVYKDKVMEVANAPGGGARERGADPAPAAQLCLGRLLAVQVQHDPAAGARRERVLASMAAVEAEGAVVVQS